LYLMLSSLVMAKEVEPAWRPANADTDARSLDGAPGRAAPATQGSTPVGRTAQPSLVLQDAEGPHGWVDPGAALLALTGDWGRRYTVACVASAEGMVLAWEQGPIDTPDQTALVTVVLPPALLVADIDAVVSCRVVSSLFDGSSTRFEGLSALWFDARTSGLRPHVRSPNLNTDEAW
jgi:hypothetical protein